MQRRRSVTGGFFGCIAMSFFLLVAGPAMAQTTAAGPYYATPSWDQTLPAATRFIILSNFNNQAVLDRNTGLVWERSPDTTLNTWLNAREACLNKVIANQKGWRLPSIVELSSLADLSGIGTTPPPRLPPGHPFANVSASDPYWSATTVADRVTQAWFQLFNNAIASSLDKPNLLLTWCVRGGMTAEAY